MSKIVIQILNENEKSKLLAIKLVYCRKFVYFCSYLGVTIENTLFIEKLEKKFENVKSIKTDDILIFYKKYNPEIKKSTVNWKVYELIKKGIIYRVSRGVFSLGKAKYYKPNVSKKLKMIYNKVQKLFPYIDMCVWHTDFLKELTNHQINFDFTVIEIERDSLNSVYLQLRDIFNSIYLNPSSTELLEIMTENKSFIIILPLVTESPTQEIETINTITLEKMLVDIFSNEIWESLQGYEMLRIFKNAISKYSINKSKLIRYAARKGRKEDILKFLSTNRLAIN